MDFREDIEFRDDSGRVTDKAKESILLMKKKMLRSHDLILQYNNKMKECDRLKGDLCVSREKAIQMQKEVAANGAKILKLESQISNHKKSREELEQKIAEQEIKIAGDKCHTEQLICKLKELETAHAGMSIEADVTKSSLEEKIKGLEQEMKKLKKAQAHDSEKSLKPQRGKKRIAETAEIGVNTTTEERKDSVEPTTAEKSITTDEFYHIRDNPYPIFCESCRAPTKPDIDNFFKTMTYHPPLLDEIASPPRPMSSPPLRPHSRESLIREDPLEELPVKKIARDSMAESLSIVANPEIELLKEKLARLERRMKKKGKKVCGKEQSVKSQLDNLLDSEEWSSCLHTDVATSFRRAASQRTVAKCIVDVLVERAQLDETLDRTYTPPAPVMTGSQQRIAALINDLERDPSMSGVFELVRTGIDFNLFRLGHSVQPPVVEYLARMLIVMARLKKDRESARIVCCDALYFLGRMAPNVIYIALTIWPEILPMHEARSDVIASSVIHLTRQQQGPKLASITRMFKDYYKFPENDQRSTELIELLMNQLNKGYTRELEVAILLIAKREGTEWAYKHIVDGGLMQIIESDDCPWISNVLTLLGFILRAFPTEDEDKKVGSMVEKLCNMLESSRDTLDKEEGIIGGLLGLARHTHYFKRIADTILKWKPSGGMRAGTIEQLEAFFKMRSPEWWNKWKNKKLK